jgi:hypothetical protein
MSPAIDFVSFVSDCLIDALASGEGRHNRVQELKILFISVGAVVFGPAQLHGLSIRVGLISVFHSKLVALDPGLLRIFLWTTQKLFDAIICFIELSRIIWHNILTSTAVF